MNRPVLRSIAAGALVMTGATILVRLLGFVRWGTQAAHVGSVGIAEPYAAANLIPNVLFEVVAGGALAGAVVPLLAGSVVAHARDRFNMTVSAMLTWTVAILCVLGAVTAIFAPAIVGMIPRVSDPELAGVAAHFLRVFSIQLPLYGIGVILTGALQAHRRFLWPALAPGFSSLAVIATYLWFGHLAGGTQASVQDVPAVAIDVLAWGTTAGVALLSLPLLIPAYRTGVRFRPQWRMPAGQMRAFVKLASAGVAGLIAQQVCVVVTMVAVNHSGGPGAFPVWQYSQAVTMVVFGVLAFPVTTSVFPSLAGRWSTGDRDGFAHVASAGWRTLILVSVSGAAAVVAAARPIEAFFGFTRGGVAGMSEAVTWLGLAVVPMSFVYYLGRLLYAAHQSRAGGIGTVVAWCGSAALIAAGVIGFGTDTTASTFTVVGGATCIGLSVGSLVLGIAARARLGANALAGSLRLAAILGGTALLLIVASRVLIPAASSAVAGLTVQEGLLWSAIIGGTVAVACGGVGLWCDRSALRTLLRTS